MARLSFGVCFAPDPPPSRWVDLTRLAEANGFEYAWLFDSHVLWQEVYPIFTLMAAATRHIKIGPCVTNPGTRDPTVTASALATLNGISGGRMVMGIGRGDSSRRVLGQKPVTVERMEADCRLIRDLAAGREVSYPDGVKIQIKWAVHELPIWVAGYGPKALRAAGRVADGVIIQLADPAIIRWCLQFVREGAEEAGRRFEDIEVQAAAPAFVSDDLNVAREQVRWFPALVSNHVVDLLKRYDAQDLPKALTDYIAARDHYDYSEHAKRGAAHADFVPDEVIDRFCVIGTVEQSRRRIEELIDAGVTQFNLYLMVDKPEDVIKTYGDEIIPGFA
ncbi:MAG: TIGR03842 family LLM class F420-dependent oxidoreductase [Candidatus Dormibacteraeota bacterium]|nr:TIGR03842 family LLM class F420-dependent oxidoreductase [Candidatus Dormibacteraeota bacterium]